MYSEKNWVLRIIPKFLAGKIHKDTPVLKDVIHFPNQCKYEHSNAHYRLLQELYSIPKLNLHNLDKETELEFIDYKTKRKANA